MEWCMKSAGLVVLGLGALAGTAQAGAPGEYWEREENLAAARTAEAQGRVPLSRGGVKAMVPVQRAAELQRVNAELGTPTVLRGPHGEEAELPPLDYAFDDRGMVRSLHAVGSHRGLIERQPGEAADHLVKRFIVTYPALWGFEGSDVRSPDALSSLVTSNVESLTSPRGKGVEVVHLRQTFRGIPVVDSEVTGVIWDGRLIKVAGPVLNSAQDLVSTQASLNVDDAVAVAEEALLAEGHAVVASELVDFGVLAASGVLGYRVKTIVREGDETAVQGYVTTVDATTGEATAPIPTHREIASVSGTYRVYKPSSASTTPNVAIQSDVTAYVAHYGTQVFPWQDVLTDRSPVPVYEWNQDWSAPSCGGGAETCKGFPWQYDSSGYSFLANPGGNQFRLQHLSYWVQRAVRAADINFTWWPPSDTDYTNSRVTVVANRATSGAVTGNDGCWYWDLWRVADGEVGAEPNVLCIQFSASADTYDGGNATKLAVAFHESGHAIDSKYGGGSPIGKSISGTCDPNTTEESLSLSETVASLYSEMMFFHEFGGATGFTDADAASSDLKPVSTGNGDVIDVHRGDESLICHAPTGSICNDPGDSQEKYRYGHALLQAYWEITKGLNCDGPEADACYVMNDGAGTDEARWALYYALKLAPRATTYRDFVGDILDYYYNDVGETEWSSRWWVFNHHDLVLPAYTYTPCYYD